MKKLIISLSIILMMGTQGWADTIQQNDQASARKVVSAIAHHAKGNIGIQKSAAGYYVDMDSKEESGATAQEVAEMVKDLLEKYPNDLVLAGNAEQYFRDRLGDNIHNDPNSSPENQGLAQAVANQLNLNVKGVTRWPDFRHWIYSNNLSGLIQLYNIEFIPGPYGRPILQLGNGQKIDYYTELDLSLLAPYKKMTHKTLTRQGIINTSPFLLLDEEGDYSDEEFDFMDGWDWDASSEEAADEGHAWESKGLGH